jgi:hypothetical protein
MSGRKCTTPPFPMLRELQSTTGGRARLLEIRRDAGMTLPLHLT